MGSGRLVLAFLVGVAAFGCGREETSVPIPTDAASEHSATDPSTPTSEPEPTTSSPAVAPAPSATSPIGDVPFSLVSYLRYGADGLVRVTGDGEVRLVDGPIQMATSDGAGGVLYVEWSAEAYQGPTWWLPTGSAEARVVSERIPGIPARLDGRGVVVSSFPTDGCGEEAIDAMVARDLASGVDTVLQCATGGPDDGWGPNSYGGGLYVGDHWSAVLDRGALGSSIDLVFRDERGEVIVHPANPYDADCHPCELTPALSPDGTRLAVIYRPEALQFRNENWRAETMAIAAQLQVFDLTSGGLVFDQEVPAGAQPTWQSHPWFDGRHVVLGPDRFEHPSLAPGAREPAVSTLQRRLVDAGADIEVDGIFGPSTAEAVEAFHAERFGSARSTVETDTWTALGVPDTIIDTDTGRSVQLAGSVALEVVLTDGPADAGDQEPPRLRRGDTGQWVTLLQEHLIRHGYRLDVDGVFGPATEAAVRDLQTAYDLEVDGIVGPMTWTAVSGPATSATPTGTPPPASTPAADCPRTAIEQASDLGGARVVRIECSGDWATVLAQPPTDAPGHVILLRRTETGWVEDRICWGFFVDEIATCLADLPSGVAEDLALVGHSQRLDPGGGDLNTWAAECSSPPLRRGDSGVCVTRLQSLLVGLFGAPIVIDGHLGPATEASLINFQTNAGLEADGYAGPATWSVLVEAAGPR